MVLNDYTIDVVIPAYNAETFIIDAIKSVEAQTYPPARIIVVNDGSTDRTEEIVKQYNSSIPLIFISQKNRGPNAARNTGLAKTTAPFVAFLDADDVWLPGKLEAQIEFYKQDTQERLGLVYGRYDNITENGTVDTTAHSVPLDTRVRGNAFTQLLIGNKILGSASMVLIRKSIFETVGTFDESLRMGEDWDMWLRIAQHYQLEYCDQILAHIRRHTGNQTNNRHKVFIGELAFYKKWVPLITGKYPIPRHWSDVMAFHVLLGISKGSLHTINTTLSRETRKALFHTTAGSVRLYILYFLTRKILNPREWSKICNKIKRHG